jgi:hypothetical protein
MKQSLSMAAVVLALALAACRHDQLAPMPPSTPDGGSSDGAPADGDGVDLRTDVIDRIDVNAADVSAPDGGHDAEADGIDAGNPCGQASREMLCLTYCDGVGRFCSGGNTQYRNADECRALCNATTWACGKAGDTAGNSLYCRLAHTALAGIGGAAQAATECRNAGSGSPACQ